MAIQSIGTIIGWIAIYILIYIFLIQRDHKGLNRKYLSAWLVLANGVVSFWVFDVSLISLMAFGIGLLYFIGTYNE